MTSTLIATATGRMFHLEHSPPNLAECVHALSNICRFNGHAREFYSVAEHSVLAAEWYNETLRFPWNDDPMEELAVLLHDVGEAVTQDIIHPLKPLTEALNEIAEREQQRFETEFGIVRETINWDTVHRIDREVGAMEKDHVMLNTCDWPLEWADAEPARVVPRFWTPERARLEFMNRYYELRAQVEEQARAMHLPAPAEQYGFFD